MRGYPAGLSMSFLVVAAVLATPSHAQAPERAADASVRSALRSIRYQFSKLPKDLGVLQIQPAFLFTLPRGEGGTLAGLDRCFPAHSAIMNLASESSENSLMMSR
jgi:hypothetical protein